MNTFASVVLAAGKGTRMRSTLPKVLHQAAGLPLITYVLNAIEAIPTTSAFASLLTRTSGHRPIVVVGYGAELVEATFGDRCLYAVQEEQLGTGHAVLAAREAVDTLDPLPQTVLVCYGDTPLISSEILARVLVEHLTSQATLTFLTPITNQPSDFGRVVRDAGGRVHATRGAKLPTEEQTRISAINSAVYVFDRDCLCPPLQPLPRNAPASH